MCKDEFRGVYGKQENSLKIVEMLQSSFYRTCIFISDFGGKVLPFEGKEGIQGRALK